MDFPGANIQVPSTIHPFSPSSIGALLSQMTNMGSAASAVWPSANLALYVPFFLGTVAIATILLWQNGATVSGNVDMGIYSEDGTKLISTGSTAQSGVNTNQQVNIADTQLGPGVFYMALAVDNTTATFLRSTSGNALYLVTVGMTQQATAFALPATFTLAQITNDYVPMMGVLFSPRTVV